MGLYIVKLTVDANSTGVKEVTGIYGTLKRAYAYFPYNAGGFLYCSFDIGSMHFPEVIEGFEPEITADNIAIELPIEEGYTMAAGEKVRIKGRNVDAYNPHSVFLWIYTD
jgi:hypothetical protein